jgi:hypothetical protein
MLGRPPGIMGSCFHTSRSSMLCSVCKQQLTANNCHLCLYNGTCGITPMPVQAGCICRQQLSIEHHGKRLQVLCSITLLVYICLQQRPDALASNCSC